jgi:hypothetical protein
MDGIRFCEGRSVVRLRRLRCENFRHDVNFEQQAILVEGARVATGPAPLFFFGCR